MRLWSLHPKYLDTKGLLALWREALLAQKVLRGQTRGYRFHPQLDRFRSQPDPTGLIAAYLDHVFQESRRRGYQFDGSKIGDTVSDLVLIPVSTGQIHFEWKHLMGKLQTRDPERFILLKGEVKPAVHPLFEIVPGPLEPWERG